MNKVIVVDISNEKLVIVVYHLTYYIKKSIGENKLPFRLRYLVALLAYFSSDEEN